MNLAFTNKNIPIAFFQIGENVQANTGVTSNAAAKYFIADHTQNHLDSTFASTNVKAQADQAQTAIFNVIGKRPQILRPPYGAYNAAAMTTWFNNGYYVVNWSVDTNDWRAGSSKASVLAEVDAVLNADSTSGHIILSHDIHRPSLDAFPEIVKRFTDKGYTFVDIETCLGIKAYK